jgi:exodeoxyribonuclease VII large subunit
LECFDDERVVRAVANCPIPVVTGIGHQRDESLADLAADLCAHTPTAAAIAAVPALADLVEAHRQRAVDLKTLVTEHLIDAQSDVQRLGQRLLRVRLDQRVQQQLIYLKQLKRRLVQGAQVELRQASDRTAALRSHLITLNPDTVVRRGYALVRDEADQLVTQAKTVSPGQTLQVQLAEGHLTVAVTEVHPPPE